MSFYQYDYVLDDTVLILLCNYNIIAPSTFSWWAAHFNKIKNKEVYYPTPWFHQNHSTLNKINTEDLCPGSSVLDSLNESLR